MASAGFLCELGAHRSQFQQVFVADNYTSLRRAVTFDQDLHHSLLGYSNLSFTPNSEVART